MELVIRFIIGGGLIVLVTVLAETKNTLLAGILSTFPIIFMTSLLLTGSSAGLPVARSLATSMAMSLPILLVFCGVFYLSSMRFSLWPSIGISLGAWMIMACLYVVTPHILKGSA